MHRILVIDDSDDLLEMISVVLKGIGYNCDMVNNSPAFFKEIELKTPALLIIDVVLRDGDGREICVALKSNSYLKNIPIILVSADPELLKEYHEYNADEVLEKPFNISTLKRKVDFLLNRDSKN